MTIVPLSASHRTALTTALTGRYRLERELGAGGMATVWLAEDLRHGRRVAIKVLHPELSAVLGPERFLAEIKTTASLQHPHILPLFDSGAAGGLLYYVMPVVTGETLRARLERERQLPVVEAVRIACEVASALDYAHRQGVIHRDIKPENILLHDGQALVADFGIALAVQSAGNQRLTQTGLSVGTPQYMAPEQAIGEQTIDARADVYALGVVVYEMLAGEPPFTGPSTQAIVARQMTETPRSLIVQRPSIPPQVDAAVRTALERLPADRFTSAREFARDMDQATSASRPPATRFPLRGRVVPWTAAAGIGLAALLLGWWAASQRLRNDAGRTPPSRLAVLVPGLGGSGGTALQRHLAISPDGRTLYFITIGGTDGYNRLMKQRLDDAAPTIVPGVRTGLSSLSVSPDGEWIIGSVLEDPQTYRYPAGGGTEEVVPLLTGSLGSSTTWWDEQGLWMTPDDGGLIRFTPGDTVIHRIPVENGGRIQQVLPGGKLALMVRKSPSSGPTYLANLSSGRQTLLLSEEVAEVRYTSDHLVYVLADGTMRAVRFDPARGRIIGSPVTIATGIAVVPGTGIAQFAVARNGTVAYVPEEPRSLVFVDRTGGTRPALAEARNFHAPMFSPDGRRVAMDFVAAWGRDVWILDLDQGTLTRATFDGSGHDPVWSHDGRTITYSVSRPFGIALYRHRPGAAQAPESLIVSSRLRYTGQWLRDGSALLTTLNDETRGTNLDIGLVRNGGHGPIEPLMASRFQEGWPVLSPDETRLAFVSYKSGQPEVYVRPFGADGDELQVSQAGGSEPVWSRDGGELFYRTLGENDAHLVAASITAPPALAVISRRALFPVANILGTNPHANFDVSPDGTHFVMVRRSPATRIMVIQNLPAIVAGLHGEGSGAP